MRAFTCQEPQLEPKSDIQYIASERMHLNEITPIITHNGQCVFLLESFEPGAIYNISQCNTIHWVGGRADVEVVRQPNADSVTSMSQSSECSPEA
jgi:hypothetical protein